MAERALNLNLISALLAAAWGQEEEHVVFSQNTGNLVDTRPPPFPSVLCINLVKIHPASPEKGRAEEKEGNNECWMKEWFPCFHYVPGCSWKAVMCFALTAVWRLRAECTHAVRRLSGEGQRAEDEEREAQGGKYDCGPFLQEAPLQTGLCDAAAVVKPLR